MSALVNLEQYFALMADKADGSVDLEQLLKFLFFGCVKYK